MDVKWRDAIETITHGNMMVRWCVITVSPHHHYTKTVRDKAEMNCWVYFYQTIYSIREWRTSRCIVVKLQAGILCPKLSKVLGSASEYVPLEHTILTVILCGAQEWKSKKTYMKTVGHNIVAQIHCWKPFIELPAELSEIYVARQCLLYNPCHLTPVPSPHVKAAASTWTVGCMLTFYYYYLLYICMSSERSTDIVVLWNALNIFVTPLP